VKGNLLPDGSVIAKQIKLVSQARGCVSFTAIVQTVDAGQIVLLDGQTIHLSGGVVVRGAVKVASVVIVQVCVRDDGSVIVVSLIVIYQLDALPPLPPPIQTGCTGIQVVVITNGLISVPNGTVIRLNESTWIEVETQGKGDKVEIKLNGQDPKIEIKVKTKGKRPEIEVKVKGKGRHQIFVSGQGKFPVSGLLVIHVCASEAGPIFFVSSGSTAISPPSIGLCVNPAGKVMPCPPGNPPPFRPADDDDDDDDDDD
jgi:hypothetical protein